MNEIEKGAYEGRIAEITETFEYVKKMALEAMEQKKVIGMNFHITFEQGYAPTVIHEISEYFCN